MGISIDITVLYTGKDLSIMYFNVLRNAIFHIIFFALRADGG